MYKLKFMDDTVLRISVSTGDVEFVDAKKMPYGLFLKEPESIDDRISNVEKFKSWCAARTLAMSRAHAKKILNAIGVSQEQSLDKKFALAVSYRCLSLDDAYWVENDGENNTWQSVCLHNNHSRNVLTPVSLCGKVSTVFNKKLDSSFDLSVNGTFAKSWIREQDGLYLYKADECDNVWETVQEAKASRILDCFTVPHVRYSTGVYDEVSVSKCKVFTSADESFVPFREYKKHCKRAGISAINSVKAKYSTEYANMIVMNYLIGNEDLHDGNWGFMLDNSTFTIKGLAPLFDFNYALSKEYASTNAKSSMCIPEQVIIDVESGKEILDEEMNDFDYEIVSKGTLEEVALAEMKNAKIDWAKDADITSIGLSVEELQELRRRLEFLGIHESIGQVTACEVF